MASDTVDLFGQPEVGRAEPQSRKPSGKSPPANAKRKAKPKSPSAPSVPPPGPKGATRAFQVRLTEEEIATFERLVHARFGMKKGGKSALFREMFAAFEKAHDGTSNRKRS